MTLDTLAPADPTRDIAQLERAVEILRGSAFAVLTGAGMSTDSGIPDYRGEGAPKNHPMSFREFVASPERRQRYWYGSHLGWATCAQAAPNPGHLAIAQAEGQGWVRGVITQNVDGLHHDAGSLRVVDLHGRLDRVACLRCGQSFSRESIADQIVQKNPWLAAQGAEGLTRPDGDVESAVPEAFVVPQCDLCGGMVKPEVVFFGEFVRPGVFSRAETIVSRADALVVAGSSLAVNTGMRLVDRAKRQGKPIIIINRGPTKGDSVATVRIEAGTSEALSLLVHQLDGNTGSL